MMGGNKMSEVIEVSKTWANMKISEVIHELSSLDNLRGDEPAVEDVLTFTRLIGKLEGICDVLDINMSGIIEKSGLLEIYKLHNGV